MFYTTSITTVKQIEVWLVLRQDDHLGTLHTVGIHGAWDNVISIATQYKLNGLRLNPPGGRRENFLYSSDQVCEPPSLLYNE
jgi:hypothetical protein